jgi:hypothetical protein
MAYYFISRQYFGRIFLLFLIACAFTFLLIFPISFRLEMIVKVLLVTFASAAIPYMKFDALKTPIVFALALITVLLFGVDIENKALSRTIIIIILIPAIFRLNFGLWYFVISGVAILFIQDATNSRGLQLTAYLFFAQIAVFRFWKFPILIWMTPLIYIAGMALLGLFYLSDVEYLRPTASNLARSSIIYSVLHYAPSFPFGYADEAHFFQYVSTYSINLYSDVYNDPHNYFLSALVWGGVPLLVISLWGLYSLLRATLQTQAPTYSNFFANSSLVVTLSTSTLSFANAMFIVFMIFFVAHFGNDRFSRKVRWVKRTRALET